MTNEQLLSKIIRIIWDERTVPTDDELIEAVEDMHREIRRNNQLNKVKAVRGWKKVEMCSGCGTTATVEEILDSNPTAVSCCPERQMISTMVPANYGSNEAEALQGIKNIIWGREATPHLDDLVESVAGLKMMNTDFLEQRRELESTIEGLRDRCGVIEEAERSGLVRKAVFLPTDLHLQTADLITSFAESLGQRLVYKQRAGKSGWEFEGWRDECLRQMHTAPKPLDAAAFAVFAWYHDWSGSYEGLVGETSVVHNNTITINVEGNINGADLLASLVNRHQGAEEEAPAGFRTEPAADLYRRIANTGAVDDALRELVSDSTDENGLLVVEAVYLALQREGKIK